MLLHLPDRTGLSETTRTDRAGLPLILAGPILRRATPDELLHGSCRKPHHDSGDGLVLVDELLGQARGLGADPTIQPAPGERERSRPPPAR